MFAELGEIQKSIYFYCQAGEKLAYNVSTALKVNNVNKDILLNALELVVAEQEALRSRVVITGDTLAFETCDDVPVNFICIDECREEKIDTLVRDAMLIEFDLDKAPLYGVTLLKKNSGEQILVICMHHIIADGVSVEIFIRELFKYYHKLSKGEWFEIKRNDGYFKFLNNENKKLNNGFYNKQKEYWKEKLNGVSALELINDYSARESNNGVGKEQRFSIDKSLYQSLEQLAQEQEISTFMLFLGAFSVIMAKYANSKDVVISSSFSYRPSFESESSVGCYIYTLPLRFSVEDINSFTDILKQSSTDVFEAYRNIGYPNNMIANDSALLQSMGAPSVFDITFICDTYEKQAEEIEGIYESDYVTFPGNMMVIMQKVGEEVCIKIQYKSEMFSDETIDYMGKRFVRLLEAIVSDVNVNIKDLDLFVDAEKKILMESNDTSYFDYIPQNIADVFETKVNKYSNQVGIIDEGVEYTYSQINEMANQLARRILAIKVGSNDLIGIHMERSVKLVVAIIATLKAGCGYVPIDYSYPDLRKKYIVEDTNLSAIITENDLPWPDGLTDNVINIDSSDCFTGDISNLDIERTPDDLAYVEYTSGSTGNPKGVMIENKSVINTVLDLDRRFPLKEDDVYLLKTTYTFDIFGTELYGWIVGKGKLCILGKDGEKSPELILDAIDKNKITHINFVPSMFRVFLELFDNEQNLKKAKSLKWIFVGGEAVTTDIIQKYFSLGIDANLENVYGPTEATMWATHYPIRSVGDVANVSIGKPLNEYKCYIVDENNKLLPVGMPGELCISGVGLARGYLNREELTNDKFVNNPFYTDELQSWYKKMYRTGDLARWLPNGEIEFLGRIDFQVKVGGVRIELGEIENAMCEHNDIVQTVAVIKTKKSDDAKICAYYMSEKEIDVSELREFLTDRLPAYMIPKFFVHKKELPLNNSGKVNRKELTVDESYLKVIDETIDIPKNNMEELIADIWKDVLGVTQVGLEDSFFETGGSSLDLMRVHNRLQNKLNKAFPITVLLRLPTVRKLSDYLLNQCNDDIIDRESMFKKQSENDISADIAIVGIAVDVPGAENVKEFWEVLKNGKETIRFYTDDELRDLGVDEGLLNSPNFVKAKGSVGDLDYFDSKFFNISPREVKMTSPQLRLLYKGAWEVLEDSGYDPENFDGKIGVFLGGSDDFEWYRHSLFGNVNYSDTYQAYTLSTNHFLATRLSYKFDFKGPSMSTLTGCSTSLVTTHLACQSLLMGECDMAIAGGITVELPNDGGYMYEDGMMFSPDGHCRPFDAKAKGTVFSNGMALVAMKKLDDALESGDHIYAVIKGSAINNDGNNKISYTAPSEDGQVEVIREAYRNSGVDPETVGYIEAHGTGTLLGDPIEVTSLTRAFATDKKQYCTLGSLKGNVGHTDTAAGIVGLAKVSLCLDNKFIPATVNYDEPNPKVNFANTPFIVKNVGCNWNRSEEKPDVPLRAGINSFGVGGTNVHFVLEEAPEGRKSTPESEYNLLAFSAKSESALNNGIERTLSFIANNPDINISDVAWTLQVGRKKFDYRKSVVIDNSVRNNVDNIIKDAVLKPFSVVNQDKKVYFMFSGQGSQYQGMGKDLYYGNPQLWICREYKNTVDTIFSYLPENERNEFFEVLFGDTSPETINQTKYSQFALFVTEYTLASIMLKLGLKPAALLGHSIGEVVAATIAGVWSLENAVKVVRSRGDLMQAQKPGSMLAVMADASDISKYLTENTWVALCNTSNKCVIGGIKKEIIELREKLSEVEIKSSIIRTSHAFHTPMMYKAADEFEKVLENIQFNVPAYPIISNVNGDYISNEEIINPHYWAKHINNKVLFEKDLSVILEDNECIGIEIGAGKTLSSFAAQHSLKKTGHTFVNLIRHIKEDENDIRYFYDKIGKLWCENVSLDLLKLESDNIRKRVSIPTYVFDKISYPIKITNDNNYSKASNNIFDDENVDIVSRVEEISDQTVAEKYVIDAYKEVFGFDTVDLNEDFFAIGGDSLKAVSLASVLRSNLGIKLDVQNVFANTTPKQLANYIFENNDFSDPFYSITVAPKSDYYALSPAQKRMYTFYLMDRDALTYNLPSATFIEGKLQKDKVLTAVKKLVERHESLRTSFEMIDGECVQIINDIENLPATFTEAVCETDDDLNRLINDFVKPFDLAKAPLFRFNLVDIGEQRQLLLFDVHHIIADGTAVEILTRDFNTLYFGDLPPLNIQYKDFALWQNRNLNTDRMKQQEEFWLNHLSGELPVLELPTDYERPAVSDFAGDRVECTIDESLNQNLKALAKKYSATNFMIMLSAWYILLEKYTGQDDIIVGTPVSGRTQDDIRETVGMFVNMLALRNYPVADKKYSDFIVELKERTLEALKNQDYQFDALVEKMNVRRELNRSAVFDVSFDYHNMTLYDLEVEGIKFVPYEISNKAASVDLLLTCNEDNNDNIDFYIDYSTSLFKEDTIKRMTAQYVKILEQIVKNDEIRIDEIDIVSDIDKEILLSQFEKTKLDIDDDILISEMFESNAALTPEKVALITDDGTEFTYEQINEKANILAWNLKERGITTDKFVGIIPSRNEYLIIAILAILKAGGAYVALDPKYPKDRIDYMISQCDMSVVVCDRIHQELAEDLPNVIYFDELSENDNKFVNPSRVGNRESLAYAIFTSGSTGMPKGVMVKQEGVINLVYDHMNREIFKSETDRIACIATPSFDIFGFETIIPLCSGASVYMANEQEQLDSNMLSEKMLKFNVTHLQAPVSRLRAMVENNNFKKVLPMLRVIVGGGESYPLALAQYLQKNTNARLFNMYGPTETTITATVKELTTATEVNIGEPVANTQVFVIDKNNQIQPVGVPGELCIAGRGLSRGYLNKPEETENKFIVLNLTEPIKVYKTGDLAKLMSNGEVELLGRLDTQVKIRGYRVELGEIERVAMLLEGVSYAVAQTFTNDNGNTQLGLFYSGRSGSEFENELKQWISSKLPVYMIPSYFKHLDAMPLLPNGKVNKKALKFENISNLTEKSTLKSKNKATRIENEIREIWQEVLNVRNISLKDNFFDIGGNSYGLMLVNNKLNELLGETIPLMQLFENPTIESLAKSFNLESDNELLEVDSKGDDADDDIAVIGMYGRFPGAENVDALWENIVQGKESIISFTNEELLKSGISEEEFKDENYVNAKGYLEDVEYFDANFFGYSQKEANSMDPQIRLLHMCVWNALEDAGYDSYSYPGKIGLFAGSGSNVPWMMKFFDKRNDTLSAFDAMTMNDKDFLTTKVSYKLNLKGPSMNVQTACSTSLVAIHQAVKYLLSNESDIAVAGGVSISYPRKEGYAWHEGMIYSKDGHCRPFSKDSSGTVSGNGCAVVVLKRLSKAIEDNDHIYAIIKGSAINNDGIDKIGYTAPSIAGEKDVIRRALNRADISPTDIQYVEAHGTGTELGDPIEIEALSKAWNTTERNYCSIGSIKANIGHLDAAAGVAGFIKAVQVVKNRVIPPMINFNGINPRINISDSPFYITKTPKPIKDVETAHSAVSAFGIGGTNAHVILEESKIEQKSGKASDINILVFSAKSVEALENTSKKVLDYIENNNINLSDAAYTLQFGRSNFDYRKAYVVNGDQIMNDYSNVTLCEIQDNLLNEGEELVLRLPELLILIDDDLYDNTDNGFCILFNRYLEQVLDKLRYNERIDVENILKGEKCENSCEKNLAIFAVLYSISSLLCRLGVRPDVICGEYTGKLCGNVLTERISLEDAINIIRNNTKKTLIEDFIKNQESDSTVEVVDDSTFSDNFSVLDIENIGESISAEKLCNLIALIWIQGVKIDWNAFYGDTVRAKLSLPGYVFDRVKYDSDVVLSDAFETNVSETDSLSNIIINEDTVKEEFNKIWFEVLGADNPEYTDDFFDLGGDSLNAVLMTSLIKKKLNINMQVSEIFNNMQYGKILQWLLDNLESSLPDTDMKIAVVAKKPYYETSSAQKRMYAVNQLAKDDLSYNLASVYCVEGKLDKERLEKSFMALAKRHESFRTSFGIVGEEVVQFVSDEIIPFVKFRNADSADINNEITKSIKPFNLGVAPLIHVDFISVNDNEHYLIIDMHHIISDQSSIDILMKEFSMIYSGKALPERKIRYIDFAAWQNEMLRSGQIDKQLNYWKKEFEDEIPTLDFPTDYPRNQLTTNSGKILHFSMNDNCCKKVSEFSKQQHITPYMLMMATLNILLWKYTAKKDIVVGTAVAGRRTSELNDIVGMFVNILPIRTQIDESLNIEEYLQYIKDKMVSAFEAQDCQFEMLIEALNVKTNLQNSPMFDIVINYVNMGTDEFGIEGLKLKPYMSDDISTKYDLTLTIIENDNKYSMDIEYAAGLFDGNKIKLLGERFIYLLESIVCNNNEKLKQISIVSSKDIELMNSLNDTETDSPVLKNVVSIFEENVSIAPDNIALVWNDKNYTYAQFNSMVNVLSQMLCNAGVKYKDKVAILLERGPLQIISIFAILKCGAVYVPIDCEYPKERIEFMLDDSNASAVITQSECENLISDFQNKLILNEEMLQGNTESSISCSVTPCKLCGDDESYIIYTSGSTGKPKGTVICHKGIIRTVVNTNYLSVNHTDKVLQLANYTFDASVFDIFAALLNGACLVMVPREVSIEMPKLAEIIKTQRITKALIVTAIFNMLVDYDASVLKNLEKIYIGGEALSLNHIKKAFEYVGSGHLVNLYGPTEATVCSTYYEIDSIDDRWDSVPIGKAVSNTTLYVVDELGNILPPNIAGELCVGGAGLAKGYLNREDIMKDKFIYLNNERVYRTGDRVMMLSDGNIIYLGRIDFQIKLRGFRVELGEIENKIALINGVKNAVAVAKKDSTGSLYVAAYYTVIDREHANITPDYVRKMLKKQVPEYMVPSKMMMMNEFPITSNGKVDRKALPDIKEEKVVIDNKNDEIKNEAEKIVLTTMREVLDNSEMGVKDNFLLSGGQSIKAIVFTQKMREMGIELMVNDIFQNPTVEEIARLEQVTSVFGAEKDEVNEVELGTVNLNSERIASVSNCIYKSTFILSQVILDNEIVREFDMAAVQVAHMNAKSNQSGFTICVNATDVERKVKNTLAGLITTHQLLHCSANENGYRWREHNIDGLYSLIKQSISYYDITDYDEQTREAIVKNTFQLLMHSKYDTSQLLWRLAVLKIAVDKVQIIWCFNHSIFDGMSAEILKRQILSLNSLNMLQDKNIPSYKEYVDILKESSNVIDEKNVVKTFGLEHWSELNNSVVNKMIQYGGEKREVKIRISITSFTEDVWSYSYKVVAKVLEEYYCQEELPIAVVDYGREYNGKQFYDCVGEFLDVIPVVINDKTDNIEKNISTLIRYCSENSINFLNLTNNPVCISRYADIEKYFGKYLKADGIQNVILYNFQGFISDEEYELFERTYNSEVSDDALSRMAIAVNYNDKLLNITIECVNGINEENIRNILIKENIQCDFS